MKKRWFIYSSIFFVCLLVITGCSKDDVHEVIYEKGLPKEDSPVFKEFMRNEFGFPDDITLRVQDSIYTMMSSQKNGIRYYTYTDKQLKNSYKPIFSTKENVSAKLSDLKQKDSLIDEGETVHDKIGQGLPEMKIVNKNVIKVKTTFGEKKIKLPIPSSAKEVYLSLYAVDKENMLIGVSDYTGEETPRTYYLFLKQDISQHQIVKEDKLHATLESGKLNNYLSVFPKVTEDGSYRKLFGKYIFEKKTNKVRKIKDTDILSKDGKYVYINGAKEKETNVMADGIQQIQTVDDYLKGNDKYEAQFKIDFKQIAKEMDFNAGDARIANIHYFNKDYVVLYISYHGKPIGTAGSVNVLIDLQKNKQQPTAYLVDLGIES
ncbi:hypothetical protein [Bacillus paralicheniformis]|uniref:hypothetical protein n=1 Tax=Bacillus paralicheniformis TaxID=1648923 RepID=UPI002243C2A1|nr:hypothetical protein [Bacillus paralicheniformis]MEC1021066.1 hypothetical protein [Bacillus paralicheniformis]MEC1027703.1 hypothetical protein [Bacillus paralicheniformis]MEC1033345.1 hypothetical protein [Bacillus paralicheniformis]MEC1051070.1 hypothetical protein [Bacillus paralicheniformis]MEC1060673.1 hypothetical protein [Bacillus paralicheniformis]